MDLTIQFVSQVPAWIPVDTFLFVGCPMFSLNCEVVVRWVCYLPLELAD